jgi:hypothetical protein
MTLATLLESKYPQLEAKTVTYDGDTAIVLMVRKQASSHIGDAFCRETTCFSRKATNVFVDLRRMVVIGEQGTYTGIG